MTGSRIKWMMKKWGMAVLVTSCLLCGMINYIKGRQPAEKELGRLEGQISIFFKEQMEGAYFLPGRYMAEGKKSENLSRYVKQVLLDKFPVYGYLLEGEGKTEVEDAIMASLLIREDEAEEDNKNSHRTDERNYGTARGDYGADDGNYGTAREDYGADDGNYGTEKGDYETEEIYVLTDMLLEMEKENSLHNSRRGLEEEALGERASGEGASGEGISGEGASGEGASGEGNEGQERGNAEETEAVFAEAFIEAEYPAYSYDWSETWDYEALVSNFYAVDNSTMLQEDYLDLDALLYQDISVNKESDGPQILIYHTHAHEAFEDSVEGEEETTIVGAGAKLAMLLEEKYGFWVLHHKGVYDEEREDAYANALPAIEKILEDNPTIEVVIDLHRDGMSGERKLVMDLQGKPTARFMFFNGLSYTKSGGAISYLENPYIQENLAFSFQAQVAANQYYPGIARKVYLKAYRYNMHLKPKTMLIELGAQNNTVEEIMNACDPLAHILAIVLDDVVY